MFDPDKPFRTRGGKGIIYFEKTGNNLFPYIAQIEGEEYPVGYPEDGVFTGSTSDFDLVNYEIEDSVENVPGEDERIRMEVMFQEMTIMKKECQDIEGQVSSLAQKCNEIMDSIEEVMKHAN